MGWVWALLVMVGSRDSCSLGERWGQIEGARRRRQNTVDTQFFLLSVILIQTYTIYRIHVYKIN